MWGALLVFSDRPVSNPNLYHFLPAKSAGHTLKTDVYFTAVDFMNFAFENKTVKLETARTNSTTNRTMQSI